MADVADGILAGYDGSPDSERALSWAGREARARGLGMTVCHAWAPCPQEPADEADVDRARRAGERILARGLERARDACRSATVRPLLAGDTAGAVLCEHSGRADMVVLGAHGSGRGAVGPPLGSVAAQVAGDARATIVVVRGHWRPVGGYGPGPIVAGADGSAGSRAALRFAFEEAALRSAPLLVVCALADRAMDGWEPKIREDVERILARSEKENPEVTVLRQVTDCGAITAVLMAAREAQLVVVGRRGRGGRKEQGGTPEAALGSVSQAVVRHAPCPVAIAAES